MCAFVIALFAYVKCGFFVNNLLRLFQYIQRQISACLPVGRFEISVKSASMIIISKLAEQTQRIAQELASNLQGGEILCFSGELGAGKTTFIQGLARGLEIKENITSPTFVIFKKYNTKNNLVFYHFDLYRIQDPQEILDLGYTEIVNNKKNISAIEWSEKIKDQIPLKNVIHINLEYLDKNQRKITIK